MVCASGCSRAGVRQRKSRQIAQAACPLKGANAQQASTPGQSKTASDQPERKTVLPSGLLQQPVKRTVVPYPYWHCFAKDRLDFGIFRRAVRKWRSPASFVGGQPDHRANAASNIEGGSHAVGPVAGPGPCVSAQPLPTAGGRRIHMIVTGRLLSGSLILHSPASMQQRPRRWLTD